MHVHNDTTLVRAFVAVLVIVFAAVWAEFRGTR